MGGCVRAREFVCVCRYMFNAKLLYRVDMFQQFACGKKVCVHVKVFVCVWKKNICVHALNETLLYQEHVLKS